MSLKQKIKITYQLLTHFLFFFTFSFLLFFLCILFPLYFPLNFLRTKHNLNVVDWIENEMNKKMMGKVIENIYQEF